MLKSKDWMRREYPLNLKVNGRVLKRVLIDSHYEAKHSKTMNDALIIDLVRTLNERTYGVESVTPDGWEIYVNDPLFHGDKPYRMIWCIHPDEDYVGVINAFRRPHGKVPK